MVLKMMVAAKALPITAAPSKNRTASPTKTPTSTGRPKKCSKIRPIPVTPPEIRPFGTTKAAVPSAKTALPRIMIKTFSIFFFILLKTLLYFFLAQWCAFSNVPIIAPSIFPSKSL